LGNDYCVILTGDCIVELDLPFVIFREVIDESKNIDFLEFAVLATLLLLILVLVGPLLWYLFCAWLVMSVISII
jgi:hypothetical protein